MWLRLNIYYLYIKYYIQRYIYFHWNRIKFVHWYCVWIYIISRIIFVCHIVYIYYNNTIYHIIFDWYFIFIFKNDFEFIFIFVCVEIVYLLFSCIFFLCIGGVFSNFTSSLFLFVCGGIEGYWELLNNPRNISNNSEVVLHDLRYNQHNFSNNLWIIRVIWICLKFGVHKI